VIHLDIMFEAYEAHLIEQHARKKDEKPFLEEVERKALKWDSIKEKRNQEESVSKKDIVFMLEEIPYLFEESLIQAKPYLKNHLERVKKENGYFHAFELFTEVLVKYFDCTDMISYQSLGVFNKKKVIQKCIDKAKDVLKDTKGTSSLLEAYVQQEWLKEGHSVDYSVKWKEQKGNHEGMLEVDLDWLIKTSRLSIQEQIESGQQYFAHHFDRVSRGEFFGKRFYDFRIVYRHFQKAIEEIASQQVFLFDREYVFERIQKLSSVSLFDDSYDSYNRVKRYIKRQPKNKQIKE
jgi:hypothetical protein